MRRPVLIFTLLFGVAATVALTTAIFAIATRQTIPSYHGQALDKWFLLLDSQSRDQRWEATLAFEELGPKTLPFLLSQVEAGRPTLKVRCKDWINRKVLHRSPLKYNKCIYSEDQFDEDFFRAIRLRIAFEKLGHRAKPAVEELRQLQSVPECKGAATMCLDAMGAAAKNEAKASLQSVSLKVLLVTP